MAERAHDAVKLTYDCATESWDRASVKLQISATPFSQGGMRLAYKARELLEDGGEIESVVKRLKPELGLPYETNYREAVTQMVAESYAQEFNRACAAVGLEHNIAFLPVSVVQLQGCEEPFCLEPYLEGEYVKHSDNDGHNETEDEVASAFCYFTYIHSSKLLVVCDIQGVGTFYTDPQVHTFDGEGFGAGNLGADGIRKFLCSHRHNLLCERLGLPSPDAALSDEELARKLQESEREAAMEDWLARQQPFAAARAPYADARGFEGGFMALRRLLGQ